MFYGRTLHKLFFIICIGITSLAVTAFMPDTFYISPVAHPIKLTGNFMELRSNHFHSGIDIKSTKGVPGDPLYAVADGFISRIKIQSGSYGQSLYIDHPNGYTSVYAHLDTYDNSVSDFIKDIQYKLESFGVDVYLKPGQFNVQKGQQIGTMGNTGRSFGPHLHFELRETKTEMPVNPEISGIRINDTQAPRLLRLYHYELSRDNRVLSKRAVDLMPVKDGYRLAGAKEFLSGHRAAFGIETYDIMDGVNNRNGIFGYEVIAAGQKVIEWRAEKFSFDNTRYINALKDFDLFTNEKRKVYLLYRQDCNGLEGYAGEGNGIIDVNSSGIPIHINILDANGNVSSLAFMLNRDVSEPGSVQAPAYDLHCSVPDTLDIGDVKLFFNDGTFYAPVRLDPQRRTEMINGQICPGIRTGPSYIPVHRFFKVRMPLTDRRDPTSYVLVKYDQKGRLVSFGGQVAGDYFEAEVDEHGDYYLYRDTESPVIEPVRYSADRNRYNYWRFRISDNLRTDGRTESLTYSARAGGRWLKFDYDEKNDVITFTDFEKIPPGRQTFILVVTDDRGNTTRWERPINE